MTQKRFWEILKEYNVSMLTSVDPKKITEEELVQLIEELKSIAKEFDKKPIK